MLNNQDFAHYVRVCNLKLNDEPKNLRNTQKEQG